VLVVFLLDILTAKRHSEQARIKDARWVVIRRIMAREGYCQTQIRTIFLLTETVSMKA
jgi:hypothetical protein